MRSPWSKGRKNAGCGTGWTFAIVSCSSFALFCEVRWGVLPLLITLNHLSLLPIWHSSWPCRQSRCTLVTGGLLGNDGLLFGNVKLIPNGTGCS